MADTEITVNSLQAMLDVYKSKVADEILKKIAFDSINAGVIPQYFPTNIVDNKSKITSSIPKIQQSKVTGDTSANNEVRNDIQINANNLIAQFINSLTILSKTANIHVLHRKNGNQGPDNWADAGTNTFFLLDNLPNDISFNDNSARPEWRNYTINRSGRGESSNTIYNNKALIPGTNTSTRLVPSISELLNAQTITKKIKTDNEIDEEGTVSYNDVSLLKAMYKWWENNRVTYDVYYTYCYKDCHSNCHHNHRSWR